MSDWAMEESVNYQEAVTEFRHLDEQVETGQWRQAQLTWEQIETGSITLREWAEDVSKSKEHIRVLYKVWAVRSTGQVTPSVSFNDVYQMASRGTGTPEEAHAQNAIRRARSALSQLPPKQKAAVIEDASDELPPEQQAQLVDRWLEESPTVRGHAIEALDRHQQRQQHAPPGEPDPDPFKLLHDFRKLHRTIEEIARQVSQRGAVVSHAERDLLIEETEWLRNALALIEDGIRGDTLDLALAKILGEPA